MAQPLFTGLTWDHPRGYNALAACGGDLVGWDRQPLEGFEAHPIADLCARYDLVVLDHPHVGEAWSQGCLRPLESLFAADEIAAWAAASIGPSLASYRYQGAHWALPLDAAAQVLACREDRIGEAVPETWDAVLALAARVPVALSIAGPHAALSFQSIVAACDAAAGQDPERFVAAEAGLAALDIMARLHARMPGVARALNPIGLLELMARGDAVALCPLVYGYVNYAAPLGGHALRFADAPRAGHRPGSTLGGTGIGVSTRCRPSAALLDHLRWLMGAEAQTRFIPAHDGQPSRRSAWHDAAVNARWNGFYSGTAATLEAAYVRPRHDGAIAFQTRAAALIRAALVDGGPHRAVLDALETAYASSRGRRP
jgi:multiple sugar transport system substrate-binding protein